MSVRIQAQPSWQISIFRVLDETPLKWQDDACMSQIHYLKREQRIEKPLSDVFDFFSQAENLSKITPPELSFQIQTPLPITMKPGTLIDYKISMNGIPMRWRTEITEFEEGSHFVDTQLRGPYKRWIHRHTFRADGQSTIMNDVVEYQLPFGPLGDIAHALFVRKKLKRIFDYREEITSSVFQT